MPCPQHTYIHTYSFHLTSFLSFYLHKEGLFFDNLGSYCVRYSVDKRWKRGGKQIKPTPKHGEIWESIYSMWPASAPSVTKLFLIMSRVGKLRSGGERRMEERDGKNLSFKESIINSLVQIRSIWWLCKALEWEERGGRKLEYVCVPMEESMFGSWFVALGCQGEVYPPWQTRSQSALAECKTGCSLTLCLDLSPACV